MTDDNPYRPPSSDLANWSEGLPESPPPFRARWLRTAAWYTLLMLALSIPSTADSFSPGLLAPALSKFLLVAVTVLAIYVLYVMVGYLEYRYAARNLRTVFYTLAALNLVLGTASLFELGGDPENLSAFDFAALGLYVFFGGVIAVFGYRIRKIQTTNRYVTSLGWLAMLQGICAASIVLIILAIPLGMFFDVLLVMYFFSAARELVEAGHP